MFDINHASQEGDEEVLYLYPKEGKRTYSLAPSLDNFLRAFSYLIGDPEWAARKISSSRGKVQRFNVIISAVGAPSMAYDISSLAVNSLWPPFGARRDDIYYSWYIAANNPDFENSPSARDLLHFSYTNKAIFTCEFTPEHFHFEWDQE